MIECGDRSLVLAFFPVYVRAVYVGVSIVLMCGLCMLGVSIVFVCGLCVN